MTARTQPRSIVDTATITSQESSHDTEEGRLSTLEWSVENE